MQTDITREKHLEGGADGWAGRGGMGLAEKRSSLLLSTEHRGRESGSDGIRCGSKILGRH
jgi:hypothetical protein